MALSVALERRGGNAWLEFPLAALLKEIAGELRKAGGIIDATNPDAVGAESLCPAHLMRQRGERDDQGSVEAERAVEHPKDVRRVGFPDRHIEEDHLRFEALAEFLHVLVRESGLGIVRGAGEQLLVGDRLAGIVLENDDGVSHPIRSDGHGRAKLWHAPKAVSRRALSR